MQQIYGFEIILKETMPPPVDLGQLDLVAKSTSAAPDIRRRDWSSMNWFR